MIQEIADIFATFHDGGIESWEGGFEKLNLKIDCICLAQMIDPDQINIPPEDLYEISRTYWNNS